LKVSILVVVPAVVLVAPVRARASKPNRGLLNG
jgi:hypothetical protein